MDVTSPDGAFAESNVAAFTRSRAAFDLKGVMSSLTVLRLRSRDLNLIERQLRAKVMQFPQFFQNSPIVLDVGDIEGGVEGFPLAALVRALSVCKVVPVAVTNIDDAHRPMAAAAGLGIVTLSATRPAGDPEAPGVQTAVNAASPAEPTPRAGAQAHDRREDRGPGGGREARDGQPVGSRPFLDREVTQVGREVRELREAREREARLEARERERDRERDAGLGTPPPQSRTPTPSVPVGAVGPAPTASSQPPQMPPRPQPGQGGHRAPLVIRQPVRSGQLIYAEKNDLIVLAPVNPGAQIIADGNIHVYSTLRGRAVAGAKGYGDARIFCQKFEAELIAIAGAHLTFDDIPKENRGKSVQISLQNGACVITAL